MNTLKFPVHHRRVTLLEAKQTGDPLEFGREFIELALSAEWGTFSKEIAMCHLFLNNVKCDEARKICFRILRKNADAKKAQEAVDLPEEEVENYSEESSDDESPIAPRVRRVQSLRD